MPIRRSRPAVFLVLLGSITCGRSQIASAADAPAGMSAEDFQKIQADLAALGQKLAALRASGKFDQPPQQDLLADAEIFQKGIDWALRYDKKVDAKDVALLRKSLDAAKGRADELAAGKHSWTEKKGPTARGYVSAVDGSTQPFGVIVPASYDPSRPMRLDVVLHGSTAPVGFAELRFIDRWDREAPAPAVDYIELQPLGRVENCYRWAGETDVFEAIEAVARRYHIDRDRIVLRGMSMGASGTWHLGLKHPDYFVALGPYCGYVDTHRFSHLPYGHFVKVGPLPAHQEAVLHMLDSVDYAANAGVVPEIACIGDKDQAFECHVLMGEAMKREGLEMVNLISHGTGHTIDPVTHAEEMRRIAGYVEKGLDHAPRKLRFVTWTLKYNHCDWLEMLGLGEHYQRAELSAAAADDGSVDLKEPLNVTRFAIRWPGLWRAGAKLRIGGADVPLEPASADTKQNVAYLLKSDKGWKSVAPGDPRLQSGKRPGLQGPIDDAFTASFLCVRGTGKPWNQAVQDWSEANLRRFAYEFPRYLRGDLRIKNDTEVTPADMRESNLILFGDPGSNALIKKVLPQLPITWTQEKLVADGQSYASADYAPALVYPSPLPGAEKHYVVLNSGHTFHEKEFAAVNYLLFPRQGDWSVVQVGVGAGGKIPENPSEPLAESVFRADFFNENWQFKSNPAAPQPAK